MNVNIGTVTNAPPVLASDICIDILERMARRYRVFNSHLADNGYDLKRHLYSGEFDKATGIVNKIYTALRERDIPDDIFKLVTQNHEYLLGLIERSKANRNNYARN